LSSTSRRTSPEGAEVELEALGDDLDDEDRARLHAALDAADDELRAAKGIAGQNIIEALRHGKAVTS
jgi:hypothetical protein